MTVEFVVELLAFIITLLSALYPARRVISPLVFEARVINTLWSIRTEALMLEEYLSTVLIASLTGEVKDVGIDEGVRFSGEKKPEVIEDARENAFHCSLSPFNNDRSIDLDLLWRSARPNPLRP